MQRSRSHSPGLAGRRVRNAGLRAIGEEPVPGLHYGGVKRWARFIKRAMRSPLQLKWPRPLVYMHAAAKRRAGYIEDNP